MGHAFGGGTATKPWGQEVTWARTAYYAGKLLFVRAGDALSLQYHRAKDETMLCLCGTALCLVGRAVRMLAPGSQVHIPRSVPHRLTGITDCVVVEVSTPQLDDVVRLADGYGRGGGGAQTLSPPSGCQEFAEPCREGRNLPRPAAYKAPMARDHRLASIAIMLASGQRLRASDLAERFTVSERTVYRDMQRLADQGFPLAAIPGPNGGYALFAATTSRSINLELDEAVALAIGAAMANALISRDGSGAARRALEKIQAALPETISCALPDLLGLFQDGEAPSPPTASNRHTPR